MQETKPPYVNSDWQPYALLGATKSELTITRVYQRACHLYGACNVRVIEHGNGGRTIRVRTHDNSLVPTLIK